MIATSTLMVATYYALPLDGFRDAGAAAVLFVGLAAFLAVVLWQVKRIVDADHPGIRAVESFAVIIPLLIVVFSVIYLKMSTSDSSSFSQPLTHTAALYFTTTILSTVGFGDITPVTDAARVIVMLQMLLDLALIGTLVRVIMGAARRGIERQRPTEDESTGL